MSWGPTRDDTSSAFSWLRWGIVALVVVVVIGLPLGWFVFVVNKVSPANVQEQWRFAYDYDASLRAIARQVCDAQAASSAATTSDEQTQRRTQVLAYQQNYERVKAEYDAHLRDAFRAGLIRPANVPTQAPSLTSMEQQEC